MSKNIEMPIIGKTYNHFDDGKIRKTRLYEVKILEIIPFKDIDNDSLDLWNDEVKECDWLYNPVTDFFIKGKAIDIEDDLIYVRTLDDGWFSLGYWAGRLDVDNSLTKAMNKMYEKYKNE